MSGGFGRGTIILGVVVGASFLVGLILPLFSDRFAVESSGADAFSTSSIGHKALVELLRELGVEVTVSRARSAAKLDGDAVLVLAEPSLAEIPALADLTFAPAGAVLLVLPKRQGVRDDERPEWLADQNLLPELLVARVLEAAVGGGEVVRVEKELWDPVWEETVAGIEPELDGAQLVRSPDLESVVACGEGVLIGRVAGDIRNIYVLADPDLISNSGLHRGRNAHLVARLMRRIRNGDAPVVFDETIHGFGASASIWYDLFHFPLVLATFQGFLLLGVLVWSMTGRFGRPLAPPPRIPPGKGFLIDNTAELLRFGRHTAHSLRRYYETTVRGLAHALHAPADAEGDELRAWLQRVSDARKLGVDVAALELAVTSFGGKRKGSAARAVDVARRIHDWREEMLHGS